jgi:hypothetical protein
LRHFSTALRNRLRIKLHPVTPLLLGPVHCRISPLENSLRAGLISQKDDGVDALDLRELPVVDFRVAVMDAHAKRLEQSIFLSQFQIEAGNRFFLGDQFLRRARIVTIDMFTAKAIGLNGR